ncbi:MAG: hypothetical protein VKJ06_03105 [Vampirovibrionales bacterium]|nr:hypothetical protein [Vampirovibrionales bacterium]
MINRTQMALPKFGYQPKTVKQCNEDDGCGDPNCPGIAELEDSASKDYAVVVKVPTAEEQAAIEATGLHAGPGEAYGLIPKNIIEQFVKAQGQPEKNGQRLLITV